MQQAEPQEAWAPAPDERQQWRAQAERSATRLAEEGIAVEQQAAAAQASLDLRAQLSLHIARLALAMTDRNKNIEAAGSEVA